MEGEILTLGEPDWLIEGLMEEEILGDIDADVEVEGDTDGDFEGEAD